MKLTGAEMNRSLHEFCFSSAIAEYNEREKTKNDNSYIKVLEARTLRTALLNRIAQLVGEQEDDASKALLERAKNDASQLLTGVKRGVFVTAMNDVLSNRMGYDVYPDGTSWSKDAYYRAFLDVTQVAKTGDSYEIGKNGFFPISPYDSRFQYRDVVLENGGRLGGIPYDAKVENVSDLSDVMKSTTIPYSSIIETSNGYRGVDRGMFANDSDVAGITRLKRYMTQDDYTKAMEWVSLHPDNNKQDDTARKIRNYMLNRACGILDGLDEMGVETQIVPDEHPGQLKAVIPGTGINVRIYDTFDNAKYVGRVYDNGASYTVSSNIQRRYVDPNVSEADANKMYVPPLSVKDTVSLVRFALGESETWLDDDSRKIGELDTVKAGNYNIHTAYHGADSMTALAGNLSVRNGRINGYVTFNVNGKNRSANTTAMANKNEAIRYLEDAVLSARENYEKALDVDRLIDDYNENKDNPEWIPTLSSDLEIAAIQQNYIDVLSGNKDTLLRPGVDSEEFYEQLRESSSIGTMSEIIRNEEIARVTYGTDMSREDMVRLHAHDLIEYDIGTSTLGADGKRFNPVGVAKYQNSPYGTYRNSNDIIKAMRMVSMSADEVRGDTYYHQTVKNRLVTFDGMDATPMKNNDNPFIKAMYDEICTSLKSNGVSFYEDDIRMDKNGIVQYQGTIATTQRVGTKNASCQITGEIGQLFAPDENGVVYTNFYGTENYAFVPGYEAYVVNQKPGETLSLEERTRLRGYEQSMRRAIRYRLRQDLMFSNGNGYYGTPTSINNTYSHLYDERHDYDFVNKFMEQGMEKDVLDAIVKTEASRVRYSNKFRDESTIDAEYRAMTYGRDMSNDNTGDAYVLSGGRNMAVLTKEGDGYFDPIATTATSKNQGVLRFLAEGVVIDKDGRMTPSSDGANARCPIMNHEITKYMSYNPFDRQNMTISNLMRASAVTKPVKVAQMTFGGWTQDDPVVVSKNFADTHRMRAHDGSLRTLMKGDKVSDLHGNKGVISLIVDPNMSDEEAKEQGILKQVEWFRANPELDMVIAPFSSVSRFNGGSERELSQNPSNLVSPDGTVYEGGVGEVRMIITDKAADAGTHIYDDEEVRSGKGRKASSQLAWALTSKGANAIFREFYGGNEGTMTNLREYLLTCGLDVSETGVLRDHYEPHEDEVRRIVPMPDLVYHPNRVLKDGTPRLDKKAMNEVFAQTLASQGGVMELPFPLEFPHGDITPPMNDTKTDVIHTTKEWERKGYVRSDGVHVKATTVHKEVEVSNTYETYGLPVMSSHLRSGQSFDDGTSSVHDYTHSYLDIFEQANMYRACQLRMVEPNVTDVEKTRLVAKMDECKKIAQNRFNRITNDLQTRVFGGKNNIFREGVMANRLSDSATAIVSSDPRLDIDQVGVSPSIASEIGVEDDDYILTWRDPILKDGGVRYLRVKVDDSLAGISINPVIDKSYDGDFDGDKFGLCNLKTQRAKTEAYRLFSMETNLLDYSNKDKDGLYNLYMQDSLDVKVAMHNNPELAEQFATLRKRANELESSGNATMKDRGKIVSDLSNFYRDVFDSEVGGAVITHGDLASHLESVNEACITTGAKGSSKKLHLYTKWLGADVSLEDVMRGDFSNTKDAGHTLATRKDHEEVMVACAVKSHGTGVAGSYSQRAMKTLRNYCAKAALELTAPVTQSLVQAKHDAKEAKEKYDILMSSARSLWRGYSMTVKDDKWVVNRDANDKPIPATRGEWMNNATAFYTNTLKVSVDSKWLEEAASILVDEDNRMINLEEDTSRQAPLDSLAYGGDYETLYDLCKKGRDLFEGKNNELFAPRSVAKNRSIAKAKEELSSGVSLSSEKEERLKETASKRMTRIAKKDTLENGTLRRTVRMRAMSVTIPEADDGLSL